MDSFLDDLLLGSQSAVCSFHRYSLHSSYPEALRHARRISHWMTDDTSISTKWLSHHHSSRHRVGLHVVSIPNRRQP